MQDLQRLPELEVVSFSELEFVEILALEDFVVAKRVETLSLNFVQVDRLKDLAQMLLRSRTIKSLKYANYAQLKEFSMVLASVRENPAIQELQLKCPLDCYYADLIEIIVKKKDLRKLVLDQFEGKQYFLIAFLMLLP